MSDELNAKFNALQRETVEKFRLLERRTYRALYDLGYRVYGDGGFRG